MKKNTWKKLNYFWGTFSFILSFESLDSVFSDVL